MGYIYLSLARYYDDVHVVLIQWIFEEQEKYSKKIIIVIFVVILIVPCVRVPLTSSIIRIG